MSEIHDDSDEIVAEDWPTLETPVWVLLSGCSAQAYRMYAFLAEHVKDQRLGRAVPCPTQKAIAQVLGLSNPKQVARYAAELEAIGAVRCEEYRYDDGMRRGYQYHVRSAPPAEYGGPASLEQLYTAAAVPTSRVSWAYAITDDARALVKIGVTRNIAARLNALQTGYPHTLHVLWQGSGGAGMEAHLHQRFAERRVKGEWFDFAGADALELIAQGAESFQAAPQ